ncbi:MAG: hypothetical protein ACRDWI_03580 [Jiangellaceae bacterium]
MRRTRVAGVGIAVVALWLVGSPAQAQDEDPITGGQTGGSNEGGVLTAVAVSLSGNGLAGGGAPGGSGGGTATVSVSVPSPCAWGTMSFATGDYVADLAADYDSLDDPVGPGVDQTFVYPSREEMLAHAGEPGLWAFGSLWSVEGDWAPASACWDQIVAANGGAMMVWVPEGSAPPAPPPPPVPPEMLAEIAMENLAAPQPVVERNPTTTSFVNLSTWFWVVDGGGPADGFVPLTVTATAGANSATVTADPNRLSLVSSGGPTAACAPDEARTEWASGVDEGGACTITHGRSSATQPGLAYTVTATAGYVASWTGVEAGVPVAGGGLGSVTSPAASVDLPVGEIQAIVIGT